MALTSAPCSTPACLSAVLPWQERSSGAAAAVCSWLRLLQDCNVWLDKHGVGVDLPGHASVRATDQIAPGSPQWDFVVCARTKLAELVAAFARTMVWPADAGGHTPTLALLQALKDCSSACLHSRCRASEVNPALTSAQARALQAGEAMDSTAAGLPATLGCLSVALLAALNPLGSRWTTSGDASPQLHTVPVLVARMLGGSGAAALMTCVREHDSWQDPGAQGAALLAISAALLSLDRPAEADLPWQASDDGSLGDDTAALVPRAREDARKCLKEALATRGVSWFAGLLAAGFHGAPSPVKMAGVALLHQLCAHLVLYDGRSGRQPLLQVGTGVDPALENAGLDVGFVDSHSSARKRDGYEALLTLQALACTAQPALAADYVCAGGSLHWAASVAVSSGALDAPEDGSDAPILFNPTAVALASSGGYLRHALRAATDMAMLTAVYRLAAAVAGGVVAADAVAPAFVVWKLFDSNAVSEDIKFDAQIELASAMVERYSPERVLAQVEQHLDAATMGGRGMEVLEPLRDRAAAIRSGDYSSCAVDPSLAHMLQSMLSLWGALARAPSTRTHLLARRVGPRRQGAIDALFQLLGLPLPLHTKAVILDALAAMAVDDSVTAVIWAGMYSSQLLPVAGAAGVTANAGIRADHINVELPNADFSYSAAYLRLLRALLGRPAGMALAAKAAHTAKATYLNKMPAYLSFVVHDILLPMVQPRALSRRQAAARWTLVAQACAVLFEIIARYGVVAEPPNASELKAGEAVPGMPELDFLPDATLLALGAQGQQSSGNAYGLRARFMPARGGAGSGGGSGAQPPGVPGGDGPAPTSLATATRSPAYTLLCDLCQGDKLLHALLQAICADGGAPALEAANASRALLGDCAVSHTPCPRSRVPEQHLLAAVQRETGAAAALDVADALSARSADVLGWRSRAALAALQVLDVACTIDAEFIKAIQAPAQRAMDVLRAPAARGEPAWSNSSAVGPVLSASHPAALRRVTQLVADAPVFPDMYRWAVGGAGVQGLPAESMNSSESYLDPRAALLATRLVWRTLCEGAYAEAHVEKFCRRLLFERQHVELGSGQDPHAAALALASAGGAVGPGTLDARLVASAGDRRGRMTFALGSGLGTQAGSVASYIHAPCAASVPSAGHTGILLAMAGAVTPLQALPDQLCAWLELLAGRQRGQDVLGAGGVAPVNLPGMDPERLLRDQLATGGPDEVASRLSLTEALQLAIVGVAAGPDSSSGAAAPLLNYEALDLGAGTCMHRAVSRAYMGAGMLSASSAALQAHSMRSNFERRWQLSGRDVDDGSPASDSSALALPGLLLDCEVLSCAAADSRRRDGQLLVLAALCERLANDEILVRKPVRQQFLQAFINLPMPDARAGQSPGVSHAQSAMLSVVLRALAGVAADANALLLKPVATAHACSILAALSKSKLAGPTVRSQLSRWSADLLAPMQLQGQRQAASADAGAAPSHPGFFLQALATLPLATLRPWLMLQPCRANTEVTRLLFDYILPEAGTVPGMRSQSLRGALQDVVLPSLLGIALEPRATAVALSPSLQALLNPRAVVDGQQSQAVPEVIDAVQNSLFVMLDAVRTHVCAVYMNSSLRVATAQENEAERSTMLQNTTRFTGFFGAISLSLMSSVARDLSSAAETALERLGQHALAGRAALTALVEGACLELVDAMPDPKKYLLTGGARQAMPQLRAAVLALLGPSSDASTAAFGSSTAAGVGSALDALMACVPAREEPPERAPEWLAVVTRLFHEAAEARGVVLQRVTFADVLPGAPWRPAQFIPTASPELNAVTQGLPSKLGSVVPGSQRQLCLFDLPLWLTLLQAGLARGRLGPAELLALGQTPGEAERHAAACVDLTARACGWARGWNLYVHSTAAGVALLQTLQRLSALLVPVLPSVIAALPQPLHRSLRLAAQAQLAAAPQSIVCLREDAGSAGPREPPSACVTAVTAVFQVMLAHITLAQAAPPANDDIVAVLQSAGATSVPIPLLLTGIAASSVQQCAGVLRDLLASYHSELQPHVYVSLCQYLAQQCLASGSAGVLSQDANTTLGGSSAAMRGHLMLALAHLLASAMHGVAPLHQLDAEVPGEPGTRRAGLQSAAGDCATALHEIAHALAPAMPALLAMVLSDLLQAEVPVQSAAAVLLTRLMLLDMQASVDEQGTAPTWGVLSTVGTLLASGRAASQLAQVIAAATAFEVSLGIALADSQIAPGAVSGAIEAAASAAGACGAGFACLARMPARAAWACASGLLNAFICLVGVLCESMPAALLRELHAARVFAACAQVPLRSAPEGSLDPPSGSELQLHHAWRSTLGSSEAERLHNALDGALPVAAAAQAIDAVAGRLTALLRLTTLLYQRSDTVAVALTAGNIIWTALQQPCEAILSYVVAQRATLTGLRCAVAATRCSAAGLRAERAARHSAGGSAASSHDGLRGPILQLLRTFAAQPYWLASAAQHVGGAHSHLHLIVQSGGIGALPASVSDQLDRSVGALWWVRAAPITPSERLAAQLPAPPGSPAYVKSRFAHELLQAAELTQMWGLRYLSVLSLAGSQQRQQQQQQQMPGSAFPAVHGNQPAGAPRVSSTNTIAASKLHYILQQAIQALPATPPGSCVPVVLELAVTIWWKHAVLVSVGADDASRAFADTCLEQGGVRLLKVSPFAAELLRRLASPPATSYAAHA